MNPVHRIDTYGAESHLHRVKVSPIQEMSEADPASMIIKQFKYNNLSLIEKQKLENELTKWNESLAEYGKELHFKYHEKAEQLYVEVVDRATREVIASLPPEFLIDLSVKMKELIGLFFDEKV
ncbi:flagellar protein FlaG [Paenibacillus aquistagni]|uniref:flagellar protein FlaG n=1 Tax=Paenibacillus aquistagni TaxID=1852522 RepID=UPI00145A1039|nr:flagellar protein FlaG [Paenibacillus aquistagni]NMM54309.1 flagellar protein FlaG [Paenibacillus aquistagni]